MKTYIKSNFTNKYIMIKTLFTQEFHLLFLIRFKRILQLKTAFALLIIKECYIFITHFHTSNLHFKKKFSVMNQY